MFQRGDRKLSSNSKFKHHRVLYVNIYTPLNRAIHYIGVGGGMPGGEYRKWSTSENDHHGKIRKWSPYEFFLIKKESDHHVGFFKKF